MRFSDSYVGSLLNRFLAPVLAERVLLLILALLWYKGFIQTTALAPLVGFFAPTLLLLVVFLLADKRRMILGRTHLYLAGFLFVALLSGIVATARGASPLMVTMGFVIYAKVLITLLIAQGVADARRVLEGSVLLAIPMLLVGMYQYVADVQTSALWVSPAELGITTRAFAFFGSPNVLGAVAAMVALVALGLAFDTPWRSRRVAKVAFFAVAVLAAGATLVTFSRSAWLGLAAGLVAMAVVRSWKLLLLAPLAGLALLFEQVRTRLGVVGDRTYLVDSALDGRLWALDHGRALFAQSPVIGTGPGTYGGELAIRYASPVYLDGPQYGYVALYYSDNQWLQVLVQTGAIGAVFLVLFMVSAVRDLLTCWRVERSAAYLGIIGALVAFVVTGIFGNVIEFGAVATYFALVLGLAARGLDNPA